MKTKTVKTELHSLFFSETKRNVVFPRMLSLVAMQRVMKAVLLLCALAVGSNAGATTYKLTQVTSVSAGNKYVFVRNNRALSNTVSSSALQTSTFSSTGLAGTEAYVWTLETATGGFYLKNVSLDSNQYLNNKSGKTDVSFGSKSSIWTITFTDGVALISNKSNSNRFLGETTTANTYKAYATSNLSGYEHDFTVYVLEEEEGDEPETPEDVSSGYYVKVSDVSTLEDGDAIIIVNETAKVALSTTQNTNNRGFASVSIEDNTIGSPSAKVQRLVLSKTTATINNKETTVFYFYTGSGYLYAASSSSNYLKTEDEPDDNARATITISDGNATITFRGTNTRNVLRYNSTSGLFSCYTSGQSPVQIYKEMEPSFPLVLNDFGYATYASKYALDFSKAEADGYSAWQVTDVNGSTGVVSFSQITGKVAAGTGVLLKGEPSATINIPVVASGTDLSSTNKLYGIISDTEVEASEYYGLSGSSFVKVASTTIPAGKALLPANLIDGTAARLIFVFNGTTGISLTPNPSPNGEGSLCDLQGRMVITNYKLRNTSAKFGIRNSELKPGIYIVSGRKVVIK